MRTVFVLGNATVDVVQRVERLPVAGETLLSAGLERCAGGKGLNQAVAAVRAGATTRLIAPVGADVDAACLRDALSGEDGLKVEWHVHQTPTDISSIWVSADGENMIVSSAASARGFSAADALTALGALQSGDLLVMQGNLSADTTLAAARFAKERGALILFNTAPIAWDMQPMLPLVDVLVANGPEARHLTGLATEDAVRALLESGCRTVVVTRGADGAWLGDASGVAAVPAPKVAAVDTAGAGDVAVGTLAAMIAEGLSTKDALAIALNAASLSVTRPGTMPSFPTRAELFSLRH